MKLCIQTTPTMSKGKNLYSDNFILSIRLQGAEAMRFWKIYDIAKSRDFNAERSDIVRELFGLDSLKLLTKDDIDFFRTGQKEKTIEGKELSPTSKKKIPIDRSGADEKKNAA